jgi:carboxypeptidase T
MKKLFIFFIFIFAAINIHAQVQKYSKVKIYCDDKSITTLEKLGIPLEGEYKKNTFYITEISENDIAKLSSNGFAYEIMIDDVTAFYIDRNQHPEKYAQEEPKSTNCSGVNTWTTPSHFTLGTFAGFYTITEMLAQLDSMRVNYPNLISVKQKIGTLTTTEGRSLYYVKISDNPDVDEPEPEVLYGALTHAREPMGMQQLIFYMWYLLENYASNDEIHQLLNNTELYFVPIVNMDGYEYNHTTASTGGGTWRKNRFNNGNGTYGIDLNRNYGYEWGYDSNGSSPTPSDDTYRGTAGFSEKETQTMKWFCENRHFVTAIDYHCYSNLLIYPWGYIENFFTPDSLIFKTYSKLMVQENGYVYGTPNQTVGYVGNGSSIDWFYGEQSTKGKIIGWSPEAGNQSDGFWPASTNIVNIAKTNLLQNLYVARFAGKYATVTDKSSSIISQLSGYFKFDIQRLGLSDTTFTVSIQPITSNIQSVGSQKTFSGMTVPEIRSDSISFVLNSALQGGETVKYLLTVNNGLYSTSDTITKIYGQPVVIFTDNCNTITGWTSYNGNWGVSTTQYYSATGSITDSPTGNYSSIANKSITLNSTISLLNIAAARLNFWAKWDIEAGYDYVQVKASTDGGTTWTALCGKYTKSGSSNQIAGSPLYDGIQSTWVQEDIDLADYIGKSIKLRFTLVSDQGTNADGFYFDDVTVSKINPSSTDVTEIISGENYISEPMPNPTEGSTTIQYIFSECSADPEIVIYDELGRVVFMEKLKGSTGVVTLNLSGLHKGIYYFRIGSNEISKELKKIVII